MRKEDGEQSGSHLQLGESRTIIKMSSFVRIMSRDHCCSLNGTLYPPNGTVMTIIKDESGCDQVLSQ